MQQINSLLQLQNSVNNEGTEIRLKGEIYFDIIIIELNMNSLHCEHIEPGSTM